MTPDEKSQLAEALRTQGVTLAELIASGREIRGELIAEQYGIADTEALAAGYQSIPALNDPKTDNEIAAIVADERAERYRVQESDGDP